jgi:hypothetical protein
VICENCELEHQGNYGSGRFCSSKCARSFSTKNKRLDINKKVSASLKGRQSPFKGIKRGRYKDTYERKKYHYHRNKDEYNSYMKNYMLRAYHKKMQKMLDFLDGKCVICGTDKNLQIDHIYSSDKRFSLAKLWSYSWNIIEEELRKCQCLCSKHHLDKTKAEGSLNKSWTTKPRLVHGSAHTYNHHKCRCEICVEGYERRKISRRKVKLY